MDGTAQERLKWLCDRAEGWISPEFGIELWDGRMPRRVVIQGDIEAAAYPPSL
jgi:hypothetical protein